MMTLGQKAVALGTILFLNVLFFLFMGGFAIITLVASAPLALFLLTR